MLSAKIGKIKQVQLLAVFLVPIVALILGTTVTDVLARQPLPLEARFIYETNFTDRDTGIQIFNDGDPWKRIRIYDPDDNLIFEVNGKGYLRNFGLTELFSESNEPNWDDMRLRDIVNLFPEGEYTFVGLSVDDEPMEGMTQLSHVLPCAPVITYPAQGFSFDNGDAITIQWNHVTDELDLEDEDCTGGPISEGAVGAYQVIVTNLKTEKEFSIFLDAKLPPDQNEVTLPTQFPTDDTVFKFEVLAIQVIDDGFRNQTIREGFFCTGLNNCKLPPKE